MDAIVVGQLDIVQNLAEGLCKIEYIPIKIKSTILNS